MGVLDAISGGLTTATNAASAQQQGQIQGNQLAVMLQQRAIEMQKERALMAEALQRTQNLAHQNQAPVLGEPGFNDAKAGEASAVAGATAQAQDPFKRSFLEYQNKLEQERQEALERLKAGLTPGFTPYQGFGPDGKPIMGAFNQKTGEFGQPSGVAGTQGVRTSEEIGNDFMRQKDVQALTNGLGPYTNVKVALSQAKAGNPAALKPALIDYASVADPKAQLRQGVMHEVMQVDPSVGGKWELAVDRLASGKLPPQTIANIEKMVDQLHQTNAAQFEQRRSAYVKNLPMADISIPKTQTLFQVPGVDGSAPGAPPAQAPGDVVQHLRKNYGITLPPTP